MASAAAAAAIALSALCGPEQAQLRRLEQRLAAAKIDALAERQLAVRVGPAAERDPPRAAAEVEAAQRRVGGVEDRDVAVPLVGEDPELRLAGSRRSSPWRSRWSGREVEQHGALGSEGLGVLELEAGALADDRRVGGRPRRPARRAACRRCRPPPPARRPCARRGRAARSTVVLPLVPVTATKRFGSSRQAELQLADHRGARLPGGGDHRRVAGHAGALDHRARAFEQLDAVRYPAPLRRRAPSPPPPGDPRRSRHLLPAPASSRAAA